jgi:dolichyl-phosphate-mannose-protein mannosyltransferase
MNASFFKTYRITLLLCILFFAFVTRVYRLSVPTTYVFDEVYHGITSKLIARNDPRAYEWWHGAIEPNTAIDWLHPPLAKYTQAVGMLVFGENSFGWRFSSVVFGVLVIALTYWLAQELFENAALSLLAAALASLDGLLLVQSRVAMNDIHVTFFILAALGMYWRYRKQWTLLEQNPRIDASQLNADTWPVLKYLIWSGLLAGLALGTKWSGLFVVLTLAGFEAARLFQITLRSFYEPQELATPKTSASKKRRSAGQTLYAFHSVTELVRTTIVALGILLILPFVIYLFSYSHMFSQGKTLFCTAERPIQGECYLRIINLPNGQTKQEYISHFHELHRQIWWYQTNLKATHDYQSRPWQWFLNLRPVWFHVKHQAGFVANIYAQGNTTLFWLGAAVALWTVIFLISLLLKTLDLPETAHKAKEYFPLVYLVASYFMVWAPWQFSPRIMFFYHYTPAVPLLSILVSYWLIKIWPLKSNGIPIGEYFVSVMVALIFVTFVVWYPNWTAIPVPQWWADLTYFSLRTWK